MCTQFTIYQSIVAVGELHDEVVRIGLDTLNAMPVMIVLTLPSLQLRRLARV